MSDEWTLECQVWLKIEVCFLNKIFQAGGRYKDVQKLKERGKNISSCKIDLITVQIIATVRNTTSNVVHRRQARVLLRVLCPTRWRQHRLGRKGDWRQRQRPLGVSFPGLCCHLMVSAPVLHSGSWNSCFLCCFNSKSFISFFFFSFPLQKPRRWMLERNAVTSNCRADWLC